MERKGSELFDYVYYSASANVSKDINPDKQTATKMLKDWIKAAKRGSVVYTEMTAEQHKRHKYRVKLLDALLPFMPDEATHAAWSLYITLVPKHIVPKILALLPYTDNMNKERLAELSGIFKKQQHLLDADWIYYVDLNTLGDFVESPTPEVIQEKVTEWVAHKVEHSLPDFEFNELYRSGVRAFLFPHYNVPTKPPLSVAQFLADPGYWATPGSSDAKRLKAKSGRTARKGKWASAMAMSLEELVVLFYSTTPQVLSTTPKRELGKARMIISGDMGNYLRMAYVSYWLEDVIRNHPHTTLFYSKEQMLAMWVQMVEKTKPLTHKVRATKFPGDKPNMTLDESKFDHMVNSEMLHIKLDEIGNFISEYADVVNKQEMLDAMALITQSIVNNGYVYIRYPRGVTRRVYIKNGILSGWRWTALLDTISNAAKVTAFRTVTILRSSDLLSDQFLDPIMDYTSQGDDIRSRARSFLHAQVFSYLYAEAGFEVHPNKYFVSVYTDEFLRKVALYGTELTGYPARGISTLVFRNPAKAEMLYGEDRIREMVNNWLMVYRRIKCPFKQLEHHMTRDIARANSIKTELVNDFVHAYANKGGMGVEPLNDKRIIFQKAIFQQPESVETPPLVKAMSDEPSIQRIIHARWEKGISWKAGPKLVRQFMMKAVVDTGLPKVYNYRQVPLFDAMLNVDGPRAKYGLAPSMIDALKTVTLESDRNELRSNAEKWMDLPSLAVLNKYMSSMSLRTLKEWIDGKLLGSVPEHRRQGPIFMSPIFKKYARSQLIPVLNSARVKYTSIQRAWLSAELYTTQAAEQYQYVLGE